jgi:hypothetical protein
VRPAFLEIGNRDDYSLLRKQLMALQGFQFQRVEPGATTTLRHVTSFRRPTGQRMYVAVGDYDTTATAQVWTQQDGFNWVKDTTTGDNDDWGPVAGSDDAQIVVAAIENSDFSNIIKFKSSDNGTSWTARLSSYSEYSRCRGLFYSKVHKRFVASYDNGLIDYSNDGITWIAAPVPTAWNTGNKYAGQFAESATHIIGTGASGFIYSANGGLTWTELSAPAAATWYIAHHPTLNVFMVVSTSGLVFTSTSANPLSFTNAVPSFTVAPSFLQLTTFGEDFWVAVSGNHSNRLLYSQGAGQVWRQVPNIGGLAGLYTSPEGSVWGVVANYAGFSYPWRLTNEQA